VLGSEWAVVRRWAERISKAVLPLTLIAAVFGLLVPAEAAAERSDLLLAALVLFTALELDLGRMLELRRRWGTVVALSVGPFVFFVPLAWVVSRFFDEPTRTGVLALGLAPTEVAAVGLVALAGGNVAFALGVLIGSLVVSAVGGPLAMSALASGSDLAALELLGRFALIVLVPLVVGVAARTAASWIEDAEPHLAALSTLSVAALVYASLSAATDAAQLGQAVVASLTLVAASAAVGALVLRKSAAGVAAALCASMRDFAVVAALATQAAGPSAATVAGVYGVLILVLGAAAASWLRPSPLASPRAEQV
jgi:predicted Na+-dependent transporter